MQPQKQKLNTALIASTCKLGRLVAVTFSGISMFMLVFLTMASISFLKLVFLKMWKAENPPKQNKTKKILFICHILPSHFSSTLNPLPLFFCHLDLRLKRAVHQTSWKATPPIIIIFSSALYAPVTRQFLIKLSCPVQRQSCGLTVHQASL